MKTIDEIFSQENDNQIIADLSYKPVELPEWSKLEKDYDPKKHAIVNDNVGRKDRVLKNGGKEVAARNYIGLEKLLVKRVNEFTFAIPVKRLYHYDVNNKIQVEIAKAIEAVYKSARIKSENLKRGRAYYASCQICTVWYAVKKPNTLYGIQSNYKLKCRTYSPMDNNVKLYPYIDDLGDMLAMSFAYDKKVTGGTVNYFETYTAERHYKWYRSGEEGEWVPVIYEEDGEGNKIIGEEIQLKKIPAIYGCRMEPVYNDLSVLRNDLEYTLSRNSDVVAYNCAPILKVSGLIKGEEEKGESRRIYRVQNGGDVGYVSWQQSIEALKYHIETLLRLFWMQAQMPDISFDNMKSLGNIGYDARQTLLMDAHLKIGDEEGFWVEFFERETNVIKAYLGEIHTEWKDELDNVDVEHIITPYVQNNESIEIDNRLKANGGKAIESQLESIQRYGKSVDAEQTLAQISKEEEESAMKSVASIMAGGTAE